MWWCAHLHKCDRRLQFLTFHFSHLSWQFNPLNSMTGKLVAVQCVDKRKKGVMSGVLRRQTWVFNSLQTKFDQSCPVWWAYITIITQPTICWANARYTGQRKLGPDEAEHQSIVSLHQLPPLPLCIFAPLPGSQRCQKMQWLANIAKHLIHSICGTLNMKWTFLFWWHLWQVATRQCFTVWLRLLSAKPD